MFFLEVALVKIVFLYFDAFISIPSFLVIVVANYVANFYLLN